MLGYKFFNTQEGIFIVLEIYLKCDLGKDGHWEYIKSDTGHLFSDLTYGYIGLLWDLYTNITMRHP